MPDEPGQVVMSRETVEDGGMLGGCCARFGPGASFLLEQTGVPLMAWDPESRLQARDVKLRVAGMNHLFPADGSERRSAEDSVLIPLAPRAPVLLCFGEMGGPHVTPVTAAGARGTPESEVAPCVCSWVFFFFPLKCLHGFVYSSRRQGCLTGQLFPLAT